MRREISRYMEENRVAVVYHQLEPYQLVVELLEEDDLKHTIDLSSHTVGYAEDAAENWVMRVGSFQ